ncbi:hypothetical protein BVRB_8g201050 [Beta vulgaris subsp. vulgaris]|uniref:Uncharacterized protein n=1 Tax=Beta vulgaris subsp. vulgaris TaxID=3555 RepID=A0A0J8B9V4_BETVV|nr:hypothetical protein BVRB_8g201050 [Beta vulgaris subsp. vulgaris]
MAASRCQASTVTPLLFIFLLLISSSSSTSSMVGSYRSLQAANQAQKNITQKNQIPNCSEIVDPSQCNSITKCRWCRSEVLDPMCTTKPEAWRLPSQVFTCE